MLRLSVNERLYTLNELCKVKQRLPLSVYYKTHRLQSGQATFQSNRFKLFLSFLGNVQFTCFLVSILYCHHSMYLSMNEVQSATYIWHISHSEVQRQSYTFLTYVTMHRFYLLFSFTNDKIATLSEKHLWRFMHLTLNQWFDWSVNAPWTSVQIGSTINT